MTWDTYTRTTIDAASNLSSWGFHAVKTTTRLGFAVTRGVTSTAVGITASVVDHTLFGGIYVARPIVSGAVSTVLSVAEAIAMAPIFASEYITSTSLLAAHSSINLLSAITGSSSSEAAFSLTSFITLVKRELKHPPAGASLPERQFGITQLARAIVAWVALQGVTQEWDETRWLKHMREIPVKDVPKSFESIMRARRNSRVRVTSDIIFPNHSGQLIVADIGEANPIRAQSFFTMSGKPSAPISKRPTVVPEPRRLTNAQLKTTLRRLSKLVLAGYGGASLLFFGVSLTTPHGPASANSASQKAAEEANLAHAIDASEAQAAGDFSEFSAPSGPGDAQYSWWDVLLGKHDHEIFERYANTSVDKADADVQEKMRSTAKIGAEHLMPRYWVLTDHSRGQIVLVLRGTMSLNEIAADLTCEEDEFEPATTPAMTEDDLHRVPGRFIFPRPQAEAHAPTASSQYHVHGGMLRMARVMGGVGKPVQLAVHEALHHNPDYDLVLCGHSLGAGVAGLLGMMWADPKTCLTIPASGLPVGRRVSVYCFAPPSLVDPALGKVSERLITSFVYSHDVVSRLNLGAIRDLGNAAMWLCDGEEPASTISPNSAAGYSAVTSRAKRWRAGTGTEDDPHWFISVRKTLEANMHWANMVPPGRVLWAMRDNDFAPAHRQTSNSDSAPDKLRLFEVLEPEKVFSQIVFARDMLSAHMPHQYDQALHSLL
ncbi:Lipase class 3 [Mycena indigotica]|uniref:sn-1-specific diacylglycerol lipase n=1 Tax=Mycena indigotica TaxID=2126181 RepID=A0A8H6SLK0_9AGAR|nr:Lipase class 3 [Mycena indigotica]KAF7301238.1 Lipase class 3 [Mycena indigotica]